MNTRLSLAPPELLQKHLAAFLDNDLEAIVSDYAPDAVFVSPDETFEGPARIREFFRALLVHFPKGNSSLELDRTVFHGDLVYFAGTGSRRRSRCLSRPTRCCCGTGRSSARPSAA